MLNLKNIHPVSSLIRLLLCFWPILLVGCDQSAADVNSETAVDLPRIAYASYLWHEDEAVPLTAAIDDFMQITNSYVLVEAAETVPKTLRNQLAAGMGPDVLVGLSYTEMAELADAGLLYDLSDFDNELANYQLDQIDALTYNDKLYGLPFMANTTVLFYNTDVVQTAPRSLNQLAAAASNGQAIAIPVDFEHAFWGLGAFGGQVFDREGRPIPTTESYAAWFRWLISAQSKPGIVMDDDLDFLKTKFIDGEVAFLIAPINIYRELTTAMGEAIINVAPIPGVEYAPDPETPETTLIRSAVPLLSIEVIAFNKAANEDQIRLGIELAQFLNNPTVQRKLVLEQPNRAPTNLQVAIQLGLSEVGNAIVRQRRTGVIIPLSRHAQFQQFSQAADTIYLQVLEGGLTANEAANALSNLLDRSFKD